MTIHSEYLYSIESHEEFFDSFIDLQKVYHSDPSIFNKLDKCFEGLNDKNNYPFFLFSSLRNTIPILIGEPATKFLVAILRKGIPAELREIDPLLLAELQLLVNKYGLLFIAAERYAENPMDYVTLQLLSSYHSDKNLLRIIRADNENLELNIDLNTMTLLTEHMLSKVIQVIQTRQTMINEETMDSLNYKIFEFLQISGVINDENGQ